MATLRNRVQATAPLLFDGAWGTQLLQRGGTLDSCLEHWNVDNAECVAAVAQDYVDAGADIIGTNTFGANRFRLMPHGLAYEVLALNRAAVALSRHAATARGALVYGTMGPSGFPPGEGIATQGELRAGFREQARVLAAAGVDVIVIETMEDLNEARAAVAGVRDATSLEVICSFAFHKLAPDTFATRCGVTPEAMAEAMAAAGADGIGVNCGMGPQDMADLVAAIHTVAPEIWILAQPNAGQPVAWRETQVYPETPESLAAWVPALVQAGATMIGGCCGTGPAHIAAMRKALTGMKRGAAPVG
jgi:5-methyltetrahydrofolate--homocysteine methyltransferase